MPLTLLSPLVSLFRERNPLDRMRSLRKSSRMRIHGSSAAGAGAEMRSTEMLSAIERRPLIALKVGPGVLTANTAFYTHREHLCPRCHRFRRQRGVHCDGFVRYLFRVEKGTHRSRVDREIHVLRDGSGRTCDRDRVKCRGSDPDNASRCIQHRPTTTAGLDRSSHLEHPAVVGQSCSCTNDAVGYARAGGNKPLKGITNCDHAGSGPDAASFSEHRWKVLPIGVVQEQRQVAFAVECLHLRHARGRNAYFLAVLHRVGVRKDVARTSHVEPRSSGLLRHLVVWPRPRVGRHLSAVARRGASNGNDIGRRRGYLIRAP